MVGEAEEDKGVVRGGASGAVDFGRESLGRLLQERV